MDALQQPNLIRRALACDPAPGARARFCVRAFLITVGSVVAAAVGDVGVEVLLKLHCFGDGYFDRSQITILPGAAFAGALLLLGLAWSRMDPGRCDRWLVAFARDSARPAALPGNALGTALLALPAALAMEHAERLLGGGLPFGGLPLLSPAGILVAAVFATSAALVVISLAAIVRSVVEAFDLIARAVHVALAWFRERRNREHRGVPLATAAGRRRWMRAPHVSRCNRDRAPPLRSLALL